MSDVVISPSMNLPIPVVGVEPGPDWASDLNACLTLVDQHDHTPGNGVQITTAALNINADLTMNQNTLTNVKALVLSPNTATPAVNMIYEAGVDLYFMDGDGNAVRITQDGAVAGTPGSIANLVAPASASYSSITATFVWESDTNIAANMDAGSILLRNLTPNSTYAVTLSPPSGLASNYQIVLPTLPASQKIMTLDNLGNMTAPYVVDDTSITIITGTIQVKDDGITLEKLPDGVLTADAAGRAKMADGYVTPAKLSAANYGISSSCSTFLTSSTSYVDVTNLSVAVTTSGRPVMIFVQPDGDTILGHNAFINANAGVTHIALLRDGTIIAQWDVEATSTGGAVGVPVGAIQYFDPVAAGTYTYKLQMASSSGADTMFFKFSKLVVRET